MTRYPSPEIGYPRLFCFAKAPLSRRCSNIQFCQGTEENCVGFRLSSTILLLVCDDFFVTLDPKYRVSTWLKRPAKGLTYNSSEALALVAR